MHESQRTTTKQSSNVELSAEQLHVLLFTLGIVQRGVIYRNHYLVSIRSQAFGHCTALEEKGLFKLVELQPELLGDPNYRCFAATEQGLVAARPYMRQE